VGRARARAGAAGALAALLLAACGGGDGTMPPAAPPTPPSQAEQVPESAAGSPAAWQAFAVAQTPSETAEPLRLDRFPAVPTSDTEEPIALLP
jgi:hypothetical protein